MKKLTILSIAFLLLFGCKQETFTGYVGQQFLLKADVPEEVGNFDYIWKITDLPESSHLTLSDIQFSEEKSQAIFIPDVAGHFTLQVTVWKYNDKLGAIVYTYDISEQVTADMTTNNNAWLNETVEKTEKETKEVMEQAMQYETEGMETPKSITNDVSVTPQTPTSATDAKFTIQVAAESTQDAAQQTVYKFKQAGFNAYIQEITTDSNQTFYRVRIGQFTTREAADNYALKLELEYGIDTWITNTQ
jgi:hypothetical protein